jgi:Ca2+-binding EF-hand superfamily protein
MPSLPGYAPRTRRGKPDKRQNFVFINGYAVEKPTAPSSRGVDRFEALARTKKDAAARDRSKFRPGNSTMPKWLANDRMVLAFDAYFKEAVHESAGENFRIRKCVITYFLADESMSVSEVKRENSGIPQGEFIKRHRVPITDPDTGEQRCVTPADLTIGSNITIYARTLHVSGCNGATREYMANDLGIRMAPDEDVPDDAFTVARSMDKDPDKYHGMQRSEIKDFVEASMGKTCSELDLKQFLKHDGKVLRFYAQWDDTGSTYGSYHDYTLHYFLADDTMEILEVHEANSGAAEFPRLLNRQKLPIGQDGLLDLGMRAGSLRCYKWTDLKIGTTLRIFGRDVTILDCDPATRRFYDAQGIDVGRAQPKRARAKLAVPEREPPPYNGYGTEEDSLGSCNSLMPKPPKQDWKKMFDNQRTNLKFSAKLDSQRRADKMRKFVITFFLSDDTVSVFEPQNRNSGIVGGKFLKRQKLRNSRGAYLQPQDFFVGSHVTLGGFSFIVDDIDEFSLKYMERNRASFPMANIKVILRKLVFRLAREDLGSVFRAVDTDNSGFITMGELEALLYQHFTQSELTKQEVLTIMRYFDKDKSGKIDYTEFVGQIQNPENIDDLDRDAGNAGYERVVERAEYQDVESMNTQKSLAHFHKKAKMGEPQAKLLQMFRVSDDQLTGQLPWKKVYGLLCSVTGIAQTDARRVMEYYFPGMSRTPSQTITYEQFSNMIKTRND